MNPLVGALLVGAGVYLMVLAFAPKKKASSPSPEPPASAEIPAPSPSSLPSEAAGTADVWFLPMLYEWRGGEWATIDQHPWYRKLGHTPEVVTDEKGKVAVDFSSRLILRPPPYRIAVLWAIVYFEGVPDMLQVNEMTVVDSAGNWANRGW